MELFSTKAGSFDDQILLDGIETVGGDIAKSSGGVVGISKSSCGSVGGSVKGVVHFHHNPELPSLELGSSVCCGHLWSSNGFYEFLQPLAH